MLNQIQLIGRLGRDPEIRKTSNGKRVINFSMATGTKDNTEWHNCVCWSNVAGDLLENYCKKGTQIFAQGRMQTRKWTDKDGATRYSTEAVIDKILLLSSKPEADQQQPAALQESQENSSIDLDDDIPF